MDFSFDKANISVNIPTRSALEQSLSQCFVHGQGFSLATLNLDHLVKLRASPAYQTAYGAHNFIVADGHPIVWLNRLAGKPVQRLTGADMILPLAKMAAAHQVSVALYGSTLDSLHRAARVLQAHAPGLRIVEPIAPPFGFDPNSAAAAEDLAHLARAKVGLCFLALGSPKQETLAARGRQIAPQTGFVSVGAGLDFLSGHQRRAPIWVRAIALEWLWRMLGNPARLTQRYRHCFQVLPGLVVAALRQRSFLS